LKKITILIKRILRLKKDKRAQLSKKGAVLFKNKLFSGNYNKKMNNKYSYSK